MAAGAVYMDIDEAGNNRHSCGDVINGARRDFYFIAMADSGDAAVFSENDTIGELLLRSENAARVNE